MSPSVLRCLCSLSVLPPILMLTFSVIDHMPPFPSPPFLIVSHFNKYLYNPIPFLRFQPHPFVCLVFSVSSLRFILLYFPLVAYFPPCLRVSFSSPLSSAFRFLPFYCLVSHRSCVLVPLSARSLCSPLLPTYHSSWPYAYEISLRRVEHENPRI